MALDSPNEKAPQPALEPAPASPAPASALPQQPEKFKPGWKLLSAFASIAIVNLACALDATVVSVALPVRAPSYFPFMQFWLTVRR